MPSSAMSLRKRSATRPVGDDPQLSGQQRKLVQVVRPRHEPADEAPQAAGRRRRRCPCSGPAWPPGRASGSGTASRRRADSSPGGAPGAARAARSGGSGRPGVRSFGTRAQSPSAQTAVAPLDSEQSSRPRRARARRSEPELAEHRVRPARPPSRRACASAMRSPPESATRARLDRRERRLDVRISTPRPRQLLRRVVAEPRGDLGKDLRRRVDEHPARGGRWNSG